MEITEVILFAWFLAAIQTVPIILCYNNNVSFTGTVRLINPPIAITGTCNCRITSQTGLDRVRVLLDTQSTNHTSCVHGQKVQFRPSSGFGSTLSECRPGQAAYFRVSSTNSLRLHYSNPLKTNNEICLTVTVTEGLHTFVIICESTAPITLQCDGDPLPRLTSSQPPSITTAIPTHLVTFEETVSRSSTEEGQTPASSKSSSFPVIISSKLFTPLSLSISTTRIMALSSLSSGLKTSSVSPLITLPPTGSSDMSSHRTTEDIKDDIVVHTSPAFHTNDISSEQAPSKNIPTKESLSLTNTIPLSTSSMKSTAILTPTNTSPISTEQQATITKLISSTASNLPYIFSVASSPDASPSSELPTIYPTIGPFSTVSKKADTSSSLFQSTSSDKTTTPSAASNYPTPHLNGGSVSVTNNPEDTETTFTNKISSDKLVDLPATSRAILEQRSSDSSTIISKVISSLSTSKFNITIAADPAMLSISEAIDTHSSKQESVAVGISSKSTILESKEPEATVMISTYTDENASFTSGVARTRSTTMVSGRTKETKASTNISTSKANLPPTPHPKRPASTSSKKLGLTIGMIWMGLLVTGIIILLILYCNYRTSKKGKTHTSRKVEETLIE